MIKQELVIQGRRKRGRVRFRRQNQVVIMMKGCRGKTNHSWPSTNSTQKREIAIPLRNINFVCQHTLSCTHTRVDNAQSDGMYLFVAGPTLLYHQKAFFSSGQRSILAGNCTLKLLQQQAGISTHTSRHSGTFEVFG